ncbi:MAG: DUF1876 domain-containing protein [Myxococcales bacterium]|nr:DUF1876 domain-containing protein [Myxococcales bacterium]MDH3843182.1 DUF1876 domain-containing protein [Myxococcales bacterium]
MATSKAFRVDLNVLEEGNTTGATARLVIDGEEIVASGMARRNPDDPDMPRIGDELAMARALLLLARELGQKVDEGIAAYEGHEVHVRI